MENRAKVNQGDDSKSFRGNQSFESHGEQQTTAVGSSGPKKEGELTKQIEEVTSEVPSGFFLSAAVAAMGASAFLQLSGKKNASQFIGQWAPALLILGLYNKLVKLHGSETSGAGAN